MIGVIADDLTGAAEIGAVGLRHGLTAEVVAAGPPNRKVDLVCMDTNSRSLPAADAARRVVTATRQLLAAGAQWIFKKTDSVLRGQVTAELEAMLQQLGSTQALLLPANPSLGRTIREGRYFVHGKPINQTDFAHDPQHPRTSAFVLKLLRPSELFPVRVLASGVAFYRNGIFIGAVTNRRQLEQWVARWAPNMLLAGGAECFGAALRARGVSKLAAAGNQKPTAATRELFVCGSASDSCRKFASQAQRRGTSVFALADALNSQGRLSATATQAIVQQTIAALKTQRRVILHIGLPQIGKSGAAPRFAGQLVKLAARVLDQTAVEHVYAEGGETAAALMRRMGWQRLSVLREIAPGVATLGLTGGKSRWLTIKPGSYSWPAEVLRGPRA